MNKDVIYIEAEDDITDIITKIENSKEKIVALVPPKKAGVFRSVVNIKLIAKAGKTAEKKIVLVTVDPSIIKLAGATKIPITKDLQTAPAVPATEDVAVETVKEELVEESDGTVEAKEGVEELEADDENDSDDENGDEDEEEKKQKSKGENNKKKTKAESKKSGNKVVNWLQEHKKLAIFGGIGIVLLILILVWALIIAPAATVTVGIRTTSNNFSENVTFTTVLTEENASEGKFYLEEKKIESEEKVEFEATGSKNVGEKATGSVIVSYYFPLSSGGGKIAIGAGTQFTISGLSYTANNDASISWDGDLMALSDDCENADNLVSLRNSGCLVSKRVAVTATGSGEKYNISASSTGWNTTANVGVYSDKAMSGGTDEVITVVQQSDIDKAKAELTSANESENKEKLLESIEEDRIIIDSSFAQTTSEAVSTPAVGEEVKEGAKPTLKATTTASVFVIDKTKVEEFITEKAKLGEDQKIYEIKDPFIESFSKTDSGYTGKLKTSYLTGPKLTVASIIDMIKGRGLGDAQHTLKDIDGISEIRIDTSFPWVTSIPSDTNKITVNLEIKDQNGNKVESTEVQDEESADENSENDNDNQESE